MFVTLTWAVAGIVTLALLHVYARSGDVFHPLMFLGPMMVFMYVWMPLKLDAIGGLDGFFQRDQLRYIQLINLCGVASFIIGCVSVGCKLPSHRPPRPRASPLCLMGFGVVLGCIGVCAWVVSVIHGTHGDLAGFRGGWDDSGYIRDARLLLFPAFLLILSCFFQGGPRLLSFALMIVFLLPVMTETFFSAKRGPTFMIAVVVTMGWYLNRNKRPSLVLTFGAGLLLGSLMLFLVSNRQNIYLGSDRELSTDITSIVDKPDSGNEFIYGAGTILSAEQRDAFFWGRRYLAQVFIRPIPSSVWPTKYEDFGVPELTRNAGTGEGFRETLGWNGAEGSAPGIVADLWTEFHWLNIPAMFILGVIYGQAWRKAQLLGGMYTAQYVILSALSVYFVMQTMEAVIFRLLILSIPLRFAWRIAESRYTPDSPAQSAHFESLVSVA